MRTARLWSAAVLLTLGSSALAGPADRDGALLESLRLRRVSHVEFRDAPLKDVVQWLRTATGFNVHVKEAALLKAGIDPTALSFTVELEDVSVATLLKVLLEPHGVAVKAQGNVVFLTSKADAAGPLVTRLYGISHITYTKTDFPAPDINLHPSDYSPPETYEPEVVVEDDPLASGDAVAELVKDIVEPGRWEAEGWSIRATDRHLVIRAPRSVHARVLRALELIASLK